MKSKDSKNKSIFITSAVGLLTVSILTSYVTFLYLEGINRVAFTGMGGTSGSLDLGDLGVSINVIMVNSSDQRVVGSYTDYGIPGTNVVFTSVARSNSYATNVTNGTNMPHPFLIRNVGGDPANVSIWVDSTILTGQGSNIQFWAQPGKPQPGGSENWNNVDNCGANDCYVATGAGATPYTGDGGTFFCNNNPAGCCSTSSYCISIADIVGSANEKIIIYNLTAADVLKNEAFLHVKVTVGAAESSGTKRGTVNIVGRSAV